MKTFGSVLIYGRKGVIKLARINIGRLLSAIALEVFSVSTLGPGEEEDLPEISIKSGTTTITVNISVKEDVQ